MTSGSEGATLPGILRATTSPDDKVVESHHPRQKPIPVTDRRGHAVALDGQDHQTLPQPVHGDRRAQKQRDHRGLGGQHSPTVTQAPQRSLQ